MSELRISVLGEFKIMRQGVALPLPHSKKTRALLAYLAVVGRPQRREHLCELLWDGPDDPRASLRWSLYKIRQVTNSGARECLAGDHERVWLEPDCVSIDFTRISGLSKGTVESFDTAALEDLAAEFGGEFLEDICLPRCPKFEAWRRYHADATSRIRRRILRGLVSRTRATPERALLHAHALRRLDPNSADLDREIQDLVAAANRAEGPAGAISRPDSAVAMAAEPERSLAAASAAGKAQQVRFCRTADGVRIAFAVSGRGPPLLRAAHWMSHVQYDWESPVWRHWIDALSATTTLIRYDERGNGLSDWNVAEISFDRMVADLESVADAAELDRFTLLGVSQSCAVSVAYAIRHPERVAKLILYGGFVKGWRKRGSPHDVATHDAMTTLIREGWGMNNPSFRRLFTLMFLPDATPEQTAWFDALQRNTVSPENAARLHDAFGEIDVASMLGRVRVPTLVLHARRDAAVPFESGREYAIGIPDARFIDLDSANHILLSHEPAFAEFCRNVAAFIHESAPVGERVEDSAGPSGTA